MDNEHYKVIAKAIEYIIKNPNPFQNKTIGLALVEELKSIKTKYKKQKFLAFDAINDEYEECVSIKDARGYLEEVILCDDGYHPDAETCKIYTLTEVVKLNTIAKKQDFTPEAWEELYNEQFDDICKHEFIKA